MSPRILVTGCAGFIGAAVCRSLIEAGHRVVGVDNLDPYYSLRLKQARLLPLVRQRARFYFDNVDVAQPGAFRQVLDNYAPTVVVHLAAQAGVRHSLDDPFAYARANVDGQLAVLEAVRHAVRPPRLIYASSSSVYGDQAVHADPVGESASIQTPASLYAATKGAGELMASAYARLFGLDCTGLRFFTVYGPWGRPDMAYWTFAESILKDRPINIFGDGKMKRDLTHIDDVVDAIKRLVDPDPGQDHVGPGHRVFNVCSGAPMSLLDMVAALENACGFNANRRMLPMQPGDVRATSGDNTALRRATDWRPRRNFKAGAVEFVDWLTGWKTGT